MRWLKVDINGITQIRNEMHCTENDTGDIIRYCSSSYFFLPSLPRVSVWWPELILSLSYCALEWNNISININININVSFYLSRCVGRGFLFPFFSFFPFFFFCLLLDLLLDLLFEDEDDDDDDDVLDLLLDFFFFFLSPELWSLESGDLVLDFFMFLLLLSSFSIMSVLESSEDDLEKKNV